MLSDAISQAHAYYASAADYSHFLVLTQSCDLVRRKGRCKSRYITICAVRPLVLAVTRETSAYVAKLEGCAVDAGDVENQVLFKQFLERVLNNTVDGIFFIPRGSAETVEEHLCAFLPLSIALRVDHYDVCLQSKVGQVRDIFAAKVGALASNLYSRIATPDLHERYEKEAVENYTRQFMADVGYREIVWLSKFQRKALNEKIQENLLSSGRTQITAIEASELLKSLPSEPEAIADRAIEVLIKRKLLDDTAEVRKKAKNFLLNDREYKTLSKR